MRYINTVLLLLFELENGCNVNIAIHSDTLKIKFIIFELKYLSQLVINNGLNWIIVDTTKKVTSPPTSKIIV